MSVWFEGEGQIACGIREVRNAVDNIGEFHTEVTSLMPGLTSVALVEQGSESVTIRTNEGLMRRANITKRIEDELVAVDFDEIYEAGSRVTTESHFSEVFTAAGNGVKHRLVIRDVSAPGFLGFMYRRFGSSRTGNAFLSANKAYFERPAG